MLNCCIEERVNNSRYLTDDSPDFEECSSDSEISYFTDSDDEHESEVIETESLPSREGDETDSKDSFVKPEGKGILNWSGWFLAGTDIPCFIPITKDKNIFTVIILWDHSHLGR